MASPGDNERVRFVREVVTRAGIDPATTEGRRQARLYFGAIIARVVPERQAYERATVSAKQLADPLAVLATHSTLYRDRGLSSDTSLFPSFGIEQALHEIKSKRILTDASVRRVAIVGPGLDFTDKEEGYDTYPLQTIQPFATIDSLVRLGLAAPGDLHITTFDLSSRVNHHLEVAYQRARSGRGYMLSLPRNLDERWSDSLVAVLATAGRQDRRAGAGCCSSPECRECPDSGSASSAGGGDAYHCAGSERGTATPRADERARGLRSHHRNERLRLLRRVRTVAGSSQSGSDAETRRTVAFE